VIALWHVGDMLEYISMHGRILNFSVQPLKMQLTFLTDANGCGRARGHLKN